jgi:uncharacterized protein (TIGR02246 family)
MIRTRAAKTALFFMLVSLPLVSSRAQKQPDSAAESAAIKQAVAGFSDVFNHHDVHGCVTFFAKESDFTNVSGVVWHGLPGMEDHFKGVLTGSLKNANRTITVKNIRFLTPVIAEVDADWQMTGALGRDGAVIPLRKGLLDAVMIKQDGHWLFAVFHEAEFGLASPK